MYPSLFAKHKGLRLAKKHLVSMNNLTSKIYFYVPSVALVSQVPMTIPEYWEWLNEAISTMPVKLPIGTICTHRGPYNWTIQTFMYLRAYGFPCELTASLPDEGIIIAHGDFLPIFLKPSPRQFIVEIKPDRYFQCIFSNFVIVQNRRDPIGNGVKRLLIKSAFVNYWPQPGLIPRDPGRGDRFENICFMGNKDEFLKAADILESEIKKLGLKWRMIPREKWHDYSEADAVVAVRPFDPVMYNRKPASKLINAWLAGVPAILSPEIAFEDIRKSELDYFRAQNIPEIIAGLKRLTNDLELRRAIVENGRQRSSEYSPEKTTQAWIEIIKKQIVPEYIIWRKSPFRRAWLFFIRILAYKTARTRDFFTGTKAN